MLYAATASSFSLKGLGRAITTDSDAFGASTCFPAVCAQNRAQGEQKPAPE